MPTQFFDQIYATNPFVTSVIERHTSQPAASAAPEVEVAPAPSEQAPPAPWATPDQAPHPAANPNAQEVHVAAELKKSHKRLSKTFEKYL